MTLILWLYKAKRCLRAPGWDASKKPGRISAVSRLELRHTSISLVACFPGPVKWSLDFHRKVWRERWMRNEWERNSVPSWSSHMTAAVCPGRSEESASRDMNKDDRCWTEEEHGDLGCQVRGIHVKSKSHNYSCNSWWRYLTALHKPPECPNFPFWSTAQRHL